MTSEDAQTQLRMTVVGILNLTSQNSSASANGFWDEVRSKLQEQGVEMPEGEPKKTPKGSFEFMAVKNDVRYPVLWRPPEER